MSMQLRSFIFTSVGKKYFMSITGLIWAGFVFTHMAGNLLLFVSADAYNAYGHGITSGKLIYFAEAVLVAALLIHVLFAGILTFENRIARGPTSYFMNPNGAKAPLPASRFMAIHGSIILVFIVLHLIKFKYGTYYETTVDGVKMRDLHKLIVEIFQQPLYVGWYIFALVLLGLHLSHGFGSTFQSLGIRNDRLASIFHKMSIVYALVVAIGFIAQPIYIFFFLK